VERSLGQPFVPDDFQVPERFEARGLVIRGLTVHDAVKDYDAVMMSAEHLQALWPAESWPEGLTLEQNLIDLAWHQKEFQTRRSFAYTVLLVDSPEVIGCVYIYPTYKADFDAEVHLWVRASRLAEGLEDRLYEVVTDWLAEDWPFARPAFPGRDPAWATWWTLPEKSLARWAYSGDSDEPE